MTLRQRLLLTLGPSLLLLAGLGGTGIVLLNRLSTRINAILYENYDSVVFMMGLNEALERIDSAFLLAMLGKEDEARKAYAEHWAKYDEFLQKEQQNVTLPGEAELVSKLTALTEEYRKSGDRFFAPGRQGKTVRSAREAEYLGKGQDKGLLPQFGEIKDVANAISKLNQDSMVEASHDAQRSATAALFGFGGGLLVATLLAGLLIWHTIRTILRPIQAVTRSAQAIGAGNLNQVVPVLSRDELGELAEAFNLMSRQLRDYRQTHLARLLRAQRTSQATIDAFPDPVLVVGLDGRVEMANPAARHLLGIAPATPAETLPAEPALVAAPWQPPDGLVQPLREALQGQHSFLTQAFDQTVSFRVGGEERAYLPQILPIQGPFGDALGAAVVLSDVTRFRLLDQVKSDLVATVSHELKTPLTSVRLVLHLLLEETVGPLTPKQSELLIDARDNAERLVNMIEHLLAMARLEQDRDALHLRPESVAGLLQTATDAARPRAEAKHIELSVEETADLPPVLVDAERVGHALSNLLDNALTYTPQGGRITVRAEPGPNGTVCLDVTDTGIGIPKEYLPHVFDRFFRVPGQSQGQGTGLGLAIVREIVTAHHGEITCVSQPGEGTTFHLTLTALRKDEG